MAIPIVKPQEARMARASIRTMPLTYLLVALSVILAVLWPTNARAGDAGWAAQSSGTSSVLFGVWGSSSADVLVCGAGGTILRYNGAAWNSVSSGTTRSLYDLWGTSSADIFAV